MQLRETTHASVGTVFKCDQKRWVEQRRQRCHKGSGFSTERAVHPGFLLPSCTDPCCLTGQTPESGCLAYIPGEYNTLDRAHRRSRRPTHTVGRSTMAYS